ncbi:MAG: amidohydrolase [Erythrobacter sp.]
MQRGFDRRGVLKGLAAAPLAASAPAYLTGKHSPVTVFEAARIVTMDRSLPQARFMAVADGMVLGLADELAGLHAWTGGREVRLDRDFAGQVIFPGLIDPHIHPMQSAVMLNLPFLAPDDWHLPSGYWPGIIGQDAWRARLSRLLRDDPSDPLIVWGHHELFHGPLGKQVLDEISPYRPLFVWQRSFHDIYTNTAGLKSVGLGDETAFAAAIVAGGADPEHSSFARGVFSETGLLVALGRLRGALLGADRMTKGFADLATILRQRGVTTACDMATGIFAGFDTEAGLIARSFGSPSTMARTLDMPNAAERPAQPAMDAWLTAKRAAFASPNVSLDRRAKLLVDGAFFAQNMRMGPPGYSDGHVGKWLTEPANLKVQLARLASADFAMHIHVNGDEGAETLLGLLEGLPPQALRKITLEHLGYCTEAQARQIARLGLMVSAQPNYIRVLGEAYGRQGLGPDRAALMNRLGTLERGAVPLGLHSDFNMAPIDPFYLAWIAQTREGLDGVVRGPEERLSREKALRAITIEAAQVVGMDAKIGSLAAGKMADFIVLEKDPLTMELAAMKELPITATAFEGTIAR